jgi:catechol 2,3-dioxygenase-like lactoylglutathione lyase family enzyme
MKCRESPLVFASLAAMKSILSCITASGEKPRTTWLSIGNTAMAANAFVTGKDRDGQGTSEDAKLMMAQLASWEVSNTLSGMTLKRMDNVGVVVDDLAAAVAFFKELGLELEGEAQVEGRSVDRLIGLDGVLSDIAMMRTPDGHGRVELTKFRRPTADSTEPNNAPPNTLGIRRIMFAVEDIDDVVARLRAHGAELVGELVQYENSYRLCYVRGPEGILVALAEKIG